MLLTVLVIVGVFGAATLLAGAISCPRILRRNGGKLPAFNMFTQRWSNDAGSDRRPPAPPEDRIADGNRDNHPSEDCS